ncbi:cell wall-active antibiotics response protein LiaF [Salirhabdus sp. Marseille-P4669]|uniref:cell wall-active antibiotics response protein LiaF n=1 Tax=Salirhabdus sp. Marseille-P4669 TaxID=2042310 RepID=UPI000C7D07A0|nr:cell wall-active antibiotics response protein LiaF [Salirhabdus sp. Marseille-P4669]
MKSHSLFKIVVSFILIGVGVLLILANFGVISVEISSIIEKNWPILIALVGLKSFIDGIRSNVSGGSWTFGSFLLIYGVLVVLGRNGVLDFGFGDIWTLWPLLLIYIGVHSLVFTKHKGNKGKRVKITFDSDNEKQYRKNQKNFVGDQSFSDENWTVEPMELWNGVGEYYFDFTKAYIPEGETPISIKGWVGDVRMLMPENLAFQVEAAANIGSIKILNQQADGLRREVFYQTPDYEEATRKLSIKLQIQVGEIRIDQV